LAVAAVALAGCDKGETAEPAGGKDEAEAIPRRVVVMDPLADRLACDCIPGYAQRRYGRLCEFLEARLGRPVELLHAEHLAGAIRTAGQAPDVVIGKRSIVEADASEAALTLRPIAMLTDQAGRTDLTGLFVVRHDDPARTLADLKARRVVFGPPEDTERRAAAVAALVAVGVTVPRPLPAKNSCSTAAVAVVEKDADAAVISSSSARLLEGCNVIDKGSLRVIGRTAPLPFITVFVTDRVSSADEARLWAALQAVASDKKLLAEIESRDGFVRPGATTAPAATAPASAGWTDWRGHRRRGLSPHLPATLPAKPRFLWKRPLTGLGLSGIAATDRFVLVADKSKKRRDDVWRCLDADTGREVWALRYPAPNEMDYSNSPRAFPVIHDGRAYLLGAFGQLHCVRLTDGEVLWKRNLAADFGADVPEWGYCAAPLIVGDRLIVNPGAKDASLVALGRRTGKTLWKSPGAPAAYASLILARLGGVEQVVGYDAISLGGWDPATGKRLWRLVPEVDGDFNVPTPIDLGGRILVTTENNGTRVYAFDRGGRIRPKAVAINEDLRPDTSTPVALGGLVLGCSGVLACLDLGGGLKTLWEAEDDALSDYAALIVGTNGRVLIAAVTGELLLVRPGRRRYELVGRLRAFEYESEVWSYPAPMPGRLYLRNQKEIRCLLLPAQAAASRPG